jgi:hypothetical protein
MIIMFYKSLHKTRQDLAKTNLLKICIWRVYGSHTKQCKTKFVLANLHRASPKFPIRKKLVLNIMPLEANFQVFQLCLFTTYYTRWLWWNDYKTTTWLLCASQTSLRNLEDQGIVALSEFFMRECWGSIGLGVSSTFDTIIFGINTS